MNRLDRYIVKAILGPVTLVMAVLITLSAVFLFNQQQDDIGTGNYTTLDALVYVLFNLPAQVWQLLPLATLIGSLLGLGALARGSEITVMRAAGVSPVRIAASALIAATLLIGIEVVLGELVAPQLQMAGKKKKAISRYSDVTFGNGSGAWVRDGNLILSATGQSSEGEVGGMVIFELSPGHRLRALGHADRAAAGFGGSGWVLEKYREFRFLQDRVSTGPARDRMIQSRVSAEFLGLIVSNPNELQIISLFRLIRYYQQNALDTRPFVFAFWSRIARTLAIGFAVLLAVPFVLGSLRSASAGARAAVGMVLGVGLFLFQRLIESGTLVFDLNAVLLAWLPTALLAAVSLTLLARVR